MGERGRIELEPATGYSGNRLWVGRGRTTEITPPAGPGKTQWAGQLDHLARCIAEDRDPIVGGEEGLRDLRIIEAIYRSARERTRVALIPVSSHPAKSCVPLAPSSSQPFGSARPLSAVRGRLWPC